MILSMEFVSVKQAALDQMVRVYCLLSLGQLTRWSRPEEVALRARRGSAVLLLPAANFPLAELLCCRFLDKGAD